MFLKIFDRSPLLYSEKFLLISLISEINKKSFEFFEVVDAHSWPWTVSIWWDSYWGKEYYCGASIIRIGEILDFFEKEISF